MRRASTLVEVLAAAVILGGAASSMLVAHATGMEQLRTSELQLTARGLAAELMAEWRLDKVVLAGAGAGEVGGRPGWSWARASQSVELVEGVRAELVTLELRYAAEDAHGATWKTKIEWLERPVEASR